MRDQLGRQVNYLRISVTDRCNFRCRYCMPPAGIELMPMAEILTYEELLRVIAVLGRQGIDRIRLTGGEPLVRKGIIDFIRRIKETGQIWDLALTTNGSLLEGVALQLRQAGLDRVNISVDTANPGRFKTITGGGDFSAVWRGVQRALEVGLAPVKLNVVMTELLTEEDVQFFVQQIFRQPLVVRFIEYMPVGRCGIHTGYSTAALREAILRVSPGGLQPIAGPTGNGPAKYYTLPGAQGAVGFITPMSEHFCHNCNRIRLTADGKIKPCLLSDQEVDIKTLLRSGADEQQLYDRFNLALYQKKAKHHLTYQQKEAEVTRNMFQVGG